MKIFKEKIKEFLSKFKGKSKEIKELQPENQTKTDESKFAPPDTLPEIKKPMPPPPAPPSPPAPRETAAVAPPAPVAPPMHSHAPTEMTSPPLFIKVDKYRDIIKNIRDLKSHILNIRDALDVLDDMQKEINNGIEIAHKTLDELNIIISNLDSFFLRPQGIEPHMEEDELEPGRMAPGEVQNYMTDVHTQLQRLRAQLKAIE